MTALALDAPTPVESSRIRDQRHQSARSAGDQRAWLAWLELGGAAPTTLYTYEWATARLLRAYPQKELHEFTDADLAHVIRSFPEAGRRTKKAAFDSWFNWAVRTRRIERNPLDLLPHIRREPQQIIDVFTDAEIARLCSLPENDGDLFLILFDTGLRRGEARALQVRDCIIDDSDPHLIVRRGKGSKGRVIPMTLRLQSRLATWFQLDALRPRDHLWPIRPGGYYLQRSKPMGETSWHRWYGRCLELAGIEYRNPHVTRHTFSTRWLRKGGSLHTLSRALGHTSIRTTADLYAHLDLRDIARDLALIEANEE